MSKIQFYISHLGSKKAKLPHLPHIVLAGRSNVGKSSLINHFFANRHLAKTSSRPGKTTTLNFFTVDDAYLLVDLPGFGFAATAKDAQQQWAESIAHYFEQKNNILTIFLLLDIRREVSDKDLQLIHLANHYKIRLQVIFTKCDKLKTKEITQQLAKNLEMLRPVIESIDPILYSIRDNRGRSLLKSRIKELIT